MRSLLSKNQIKFVRSLKQKKYRYYNKKYIVEGPRMIYDLIEERPHLIQYIICAKDSKSISIPADIPSYELNRDIFKDLRSEEHTSELQSRGHLVCRLLLEKKKIKSK